MVMEGIKTAKISHQQLFILVVSKPKNNSLKFDFF